MATKTKTKKTSVKTAKKSSDIPEFIEGIPTKKSRKDERTELVKGYYKELWRRLDRENSIRLNIGQNPEDSGRYIINDLGIKIHVQEGLSDKKAINGSVNNWQSTYAVKHLYRIVKKAKPLDKKYDNPKSSQKKKGFKKMMILYYQFSNSKFDYLNFTVKLTIGIRAMGKHIQYAVNKIETKK